jgi:hypothetical protein
LVNILVVGVGFDVDEVYWQRFICDSLCDIPYICHLMSVPLQRLFDIVYLCRGMQVRDYHTEIPVLSWFICVKLCIFSINALMIVVYTELSVGCTQTWS